MAGIQWKGTTAIVQFTGPDKRRRTIRLQKLSARNAERFVDKLEQANTLARLGQPLDEKLIEWRDGLGEKLADQLAEYGVLPKREASTLGAFITAYVKMRADVKGSTSTVYGHAERNLLAFFGAETSLRDITSGDADEFRLHLMKPKATDGTGGEGLSENTANRRCTMASQFFRAARRKGLITSNVFEGVGGAVKSNKARMYYVTREEAAKVLDACPDQEWRLIFALSRFGGLRTPSEHYGLRLGDIDWAGNKFLVHSPKTEHHAGGESRWVPIFPELRTLLLESAESAGEGEEYVIRRYRNQASLRTRFEKIIKRAGLKPWPKLFQNLRSTRQTELTAQYPLHVVCTWLGNKAAVAAEHYLQVTDADFAKAATTSAVNALHVGRNLAHSETTGHDRDVAETAENCGELSQTVSAVFDLVGGKGLEPLTPSV